MFLISYFRNENVDKLYSINQVAHRLGKAHQTVKKWVTEGTLPATPIKQKYRKPLYKRFLPPATIKTTYK
jgi:transposase